MMDLDLGSDHKRSAWVPVVFAPLINQFGDRAGL
jgi:hypothetical protein